MSWPHNGNEIQCADEYAEYYYDAGPVDGSDDEDKAKVETETAEGEAKKKIEDKSRKEAMKEQAKEKSKVTNELQQIEKIFDEKGYDKTAFNKGGKKNAAASGDDGDAVPGPQKKRRI